MSFADVAALLPVDLPVRLAQVTLLLAVLLVLDRLGRGRIWPQLLGTLWWLVPLRAVLPTDLGSPVAAVSRETGLAAAPIAGTVPTVPAWALIWLGGALAFGVTGTLLRLRERRRLLAHAEAPAEVDPARAALRRAATALGLRRPVTLLRSAAASGPVVCGLLRPAVVLPIDDHGDPRGLTHILLHELMHVRRRDPLRRELVALGVALLWFHPLAWLARRRVEELRELCCDAAVASRLGDGAADYRRTLLRTARDWLPASGAAVGWLSPRHPLLERLDWLDREAWRHPLRRRLTTALATVAVVACGMPVVREVETHATRPVQVGPQSVATAVDPVPGPDPRPVPPELRAAARETLERHARGEPGCIQARWAALLLHQTETNSPDRAGTEESR